MCALSVAVMLLAFCAPWDPLSRLPPAREEIVAQFSSDDSKFFEFRREHVGEPVSDNRPLLPPEVVTRRVEDVLELTGYCRDGFFELYRQWVRGGLTVRGECREEASEADRAQFSDGAVIFTREP